MLWVLLLATIIALNGWLRSACLVPYLVAREPEYLLLLPSLLWLAVWFGAAVANRLRCAPRGPAGSRRFCSHAAARRRRPARDTVAR
jgi:hypothetical protein